MKIEVTEDLGLLLKEIYSGVTFETSDGNRMTLCMRDNTFELSVTPKSGCPTRRFRVDMEKCEIDRTQSRN